MDGYRGRMSTVRLFGVRLLALVVCVSGAWSCGPSLSDRPDDFEGDDTIAIATLCGGKEMVDGKENGFWMKAAVRFDKDLEVYWDRTQFGLENAILTRKASGWAVAVDDKLKRKTTTYWVTNAPGVIAGQHAKVGPVVVLYRGGDGQLAKAVSKSCDVLIR